jgi:hypothetical protein
MSTVNLYTNYFSDRVIANHERLLAGTLGAYEYYESLCHDVHMNINDSRFKVVYKLRIDIADKERVALPKPKVTVEVTFEAYENEDVSICSPSASKTIKYNVTITTEEITEQVKEAIDKYRELINDYPMPHLDFDFWTQTAKLMKQFDKNGASTARDNSDFLELI